MSACVRCRPTARPRAPRRLAEGKADLAIIRGDLEVPKNAQAVATLRKNVAVLWVPPAAKAKGKKAGPKITKIRPARRTPHRRGRPHPGQCQFAQGDPAAIRRRSEPRSRSSSSRPAKPRTPSATRRRMPISPPDRSTARSPRMRSRHRRATAARRPSSRSIRPRRLRKTTRSMRRPKFPPAPSAARPPSPRTR